MSRLSFIYRHDPFYLVRKVAGSKGKRVFLIKTKIDYDQLGNQLHDENTLYTVRSILCFYKDHSKSKYFGAIFLLKGVNFGPWIQNVDSTMKNIPIYTILLLHFDIISNVDRTLICKSYPMFLQWPQKAVVCTSTMHYHLLLSS